MEAVDEERRVKIEVKAALRAKNMSPPGIAPADLKKLDTSLKKNTAFCKKLKTLTAEQLPALMRELLSLKLEKYLSELVASLVEAKLARSSDVWAAVEIASLLHQRFKDDFTGEFKVALLKLFGPPPNLQGLSQEQRERDEAARIARQKTALKMTSELYLVGVLSDADAKTVRVDGLVPAVMKDGLIPGILKTMFVNDKEFLNVPLATSFVKNFANTFLNISKDLESTQLATLDSMVSPDIRGIVNGVMLDYFKSVSKYLVRMHKHIRKMEQSNYEHSISRGEVSEERQERFQKGTKIYEKLLANTKILAANLSAEMPELPEEESAVKIGVGMTIGNSRDDRDGQGSGIWEDEDARLFYEEIIDLRNFVPTVLLGEKHVSALEEVLVKPEEVDVEKADAEQADDVIGAESPDKADYAEEDLEEDTAAVEDGEDEKTTNASAVARAAVDTLLTKMPTSLSRDAMDNLAVEFCFLNSKTARKKLVTHVANMPKNRQDLLPHYSRFLATVKPYFPDVIEKVTAQIRSEFIRQLRRKEKGFLDEKIRTVRFIGELTKFRVVPITFTFFVFQKLLEEFSNVNIELASNFLESCGRFLFKSPDISPAFTPMLETMMRKKAVLNVDSRQQMLIENAFYMCNPPDRPAIEVKQRSPLELYLRKLFYSDLARRSVDKVTKQLRKLNWEDAETLKLLRKLFRKVWKVKFANVHLVAFMASELARYYSFFGIYVVDQCLEEIRIELEVNLFKHNQRRISSVRFLGELYNYRLVDSGVIFDTLYFLLRFGYESQMPEPGVACMLDATHDFFRIRLRLDEFLLFFQIYVLSKDPIPMDISFLLSETGELLRPKQTLLTSYEEAIEAFNALIALNHPNGKGAVNATAAEASDEEDDGLRDDDGRRGSGAGQEGSGDENEDEDEDEDDEDEDDEEGVGKVNLEDEEAVVIRRVEEIDQAADDEFEKEFNQAMIDSLRSRDNVRKPAVFDVPIPGKAKIAGSGEEAENGVVFSLLTKKGNKQQMKPMAIPKDSSFVLNTRMRQEMEQEDKKQLKDIVLKYQERDEDGE
ncbi:hypothetical protein HK101_000477, partial [Irineochytrium annulatum]